MVSVTLFLCSSTHSQQRPCLGQSVFGQEQYVLISVLAGHAEAIVSIVTSKRIVLNITTTDNKKLKTEMNEIEIKDS